MATELTVILQQIRNTNSSLKKVSIIRKYRERLRLVLYYTYSPYMMFHIRAIPEDVQGKGNRSLDMSTFTILYDMVQRKITGNNARLMLFNYMESLTSDDAEVLKLIVKKNLNIGANIKLINSAYDTELIRVHKVMLATKFDLKHIQWPTLATIKIDGIRATYSKGIFYTRNGHKVSGLDHLVGSLEFSDSGWQLDGELYIPDVPFDRASGIIRSLSTEKPNVHYAVFDTRHDYSKPQKERLDWLAARLPACGSGFVIEHIPYREVFNLNDLMAIYRRVRLAGKEGLVVKNPFGTYVEKRSNLWMKMKPVSSEEYKIVNYFEGEGKYSGMLGGFIVQVGSKEVRVGSGFSDPERTEIWENPTKYLGRWATVESMEKTAAGRLRHPIYKSVRWDI